MVGHKHGAQSAANFLLVEPAAVHDDPLLPNYWHLHNPASGQKGVNVLDVWNEYRGGGIVVGVIDDGVDYTHIELAARYGYTLDFDARSNDFDAFPSSSGDKHGTAVAGVIGAAVGNAAGGAGVAPEATIVGYRIGFGAAGSIAQLDAVFDRLDSLDIANNSWGFSGFLGDNFASADFAASAAGLEEALDSGRGGLGTVVVFAAGNGRAGGQDVNYHNFQNHRGIISVAATTSTGSVASFSTPGDAILVSAPGVSVPTTDRVGAAGYSSGDYTTLSGTSFAAPIVSGVTALMLDANPGLGWRDVQEILASTAIQTGSATSWTFNHASNWNGGAMHVSRDFGFGLVDTMDAVRVAESWRQVSNSANEAFVSASASPFAAIPDLGSLQSTLELADGVRVDRVELDVVLEHTNIGDVRIVLTSPTGTDSVLFNRPPTTQDNIVFTFSTTHDWGELSGGAWKITITDGVAGATGTLHSWAIRAFGDPAGHDIYVYTDEFSTLAAANPARLSLADSSGVDVVNTAAIASDTVLDLRDGQVSSIDGQSVTIASGSVIENADTGDGNDTIVGNEAANWLRGWRGNDTFDGGAGVDRLEGGQGDDIYIIDTALDDVIENADSGIDTVRTPVTYTLAANVENLTLIGIAAINGSGNALNNAINGNSADNTLNGGAGADTMAGDLGNDTYVVDNKADLVVEIAGAGSDTINSSVTYTLPANVETLVLTGSVSINGTGNALNNTLKGNHWANTLNGGAGADIMSGAGGYDTYIVDNPGDVVVEYSRGGIDTVKSSVTYTLAVNVEKLVLTGSTAINGSGNTLNNGLTGNSAKNQLFGLNGNDTLNGAAGADLMDGGGGNDTYYVDNAGDSVIEGASGGTDLVYSSITHALADNLENLTLTGAKVINGTGNALANTIRGNSAANVLDGALAVDELFGGAGNDIFRFVQGEANGDTVRDFVGNGPSAGDSLLFVDFGANATFAQVASSEDWMISYNGGSMTEMLHLIGVTSLDPTDYAFV